MPRVPEYEPSVSLRPAFRQNVDVQASPDAFGASIGRGMQGLAAGVGNLGDAVAQVKALEDEAVVRGARNEFIQKSDALRYDPETGYLQKDGKAALDAFPDYQRKVEGLRKELTSSLNLTPAQQNLFAKSVEPLEADAKRQGLIHKGGALKSYVEQEARSGADNFKQQALQNYRNPAAWQKYTTAGLLEIEGLGEKLGWSPEKLKQEKQDYSSDAMRLTALTMADDDPVAAAEFAVKHRDAMTVTDHLTLVRELMPRLNDAVTADAVTVSAANPGPRQFAASGLPSEAYGLLGVIAGTESPGYNVINGGARFSGFGDHPRTKGAGGTSTAAGRYQFVKGTWDRVSKSLGLPDFSPISQDVAAWWLAQQDYKSRTGRDLTADINAGNYSAVRAGLADTWEGVKKLTDEQFAARMKGAGASPVQTGGKFSPRVEGMLAGLPEGLSTRLRDAAETGVATFETQQNAQIKAVRLAAVDDYRLRIADNDLSLTRQEILDDPVIDKGDKATLLNSYKEARKGVFETQEALTAFNAGKLAVDPYDGDGRKLVDSVWKSIASTVDPSQLRSNAEALVRQTGVVPGPVMNAMRSDLSSTSVNVVATAAEMASRIRTIDPAALGRREGGKELQDAAATYAHLTDTVGLSRQEAAGRIIDLRDPEKARQRAALMESKPITDFVKAQAVEGRVRDIFDPGAFGFDPKLGETPAQSAAMVADYKSILEESLFDAAGDQGHATALAADRFRRRYGTSDFTISGSKVITRLPPEVTYPVGSDGTHDYIREQAKAALSGAGVSADAIYLQADALTERDVSAGKPARYQVFYEKDGVIEQWNKPFFATAPTGSELSAARKARSEARRDENRNQREAGRDRDGTLDSFLDGNPLTGGQ